MSTYIDDLDNLVIYKKPFFAPINEENKRKGSAIMLLTPNVESSKKLMNYPFMINNNLFESYYIEKDITYFINNENCLVKKFDDMLITEGKLSSNKRNRLDDSEFGLPKERKYPLNDEAHVKAAIKMFSYCPENKKKQLAKNIKRKADEYGIEIGSDSKVSQYIKESTILEFASETDKDFKPKGNKSLSNFKQIKISDDVIDKYKKEYKSLKHVDTDSDHSGYLYLDKDNVVGYVNVDTDNSFIQALEVDKKYQGYGLSKQLLNVATTKLAANKLSVNKNNEVAVQLYKRNGWRTYKQTDRMLFMSKKAINESTILESANSNDFEYRLEDWVSDNVKILFITGIAGSGKSTIGKELSNKYDVKYIELDEVYRKLSKEYKERPKAEDVVNEAIKLSNNKKCIIEGIHILFLEDLSKVKQNALIIKEINPVQSTIKAINRDLFIDKVYKKEQFNLDTFKQKIDFVIHNILINYSKINYNLYKSDSVKKLKSNIKENFQLNGETVIGKQKEYDYYKKHKSYHDKIVTDYLSCGDRWETINKFNLEEEDFDSILSLHSKYSDYFDESVVLESQDISDYKSIPYTIENINKYVPKNLIPNKPIEKTTGYLFVDYSQDPKYAGHVSVCDGEIVSIGSWGKYNKELENDLKQLVKDQINEVTEYKGYFLNSQEQYKLEDTHLRVNHEGNNFIIYFNDILEEQVLIESGNQHDKMLRRFLYDERIRNNKEAFLLYDEIKRDIPWIKKTFIDYKYYNSFNIFIDWSYYTQSFFRNNIYKLDKGIDLYFDFVNRFLNDKRLELNGYTKKTVIVPVLDWIPKEENIDAWDYTKTLNPISTIYRLMKTNPNKLREKWGRYQFLFVSDSGYFRVDFSNFELKDLTVFINNIRRFINKDIVIDDTKNKESSKAIVAKIVDDIEYSQGIKINNLTGGTDTLTPDEVKERLDKGITTSDQDEKKARVVQLIKQSADKSNNVDDTIDSMETGIDNEYIKSLLIDLQNDEDDTIKINKARASRMAEINNKFLDKEIKGTKIRDMIKNSKQEVELPKKELPVENVNKEWKELKFANFEDVYNLQDDIISIIYSFSEKSVPILVRDIKIEDNSTSEDMINTYTVEWEDSFGQRFTTKMDIPKIKNNKFMKLRGNDKTISGQLMLLPIIKTDEDTVQIVSNYNKIFVRRYGTNSGKSYVVTDRLMKTFEKIDDPSIVITYGDNTKICSKYELPIDYIDLAGTYSKIELKGSCVFYFNQDELREKYKVDDSKGIAIGVRLGSNTKGPNDEIMYYEGWSGTVSDYILRNCINREMNGRVEFNDKFKEVYESTSTSSKYTYSKASILNTEIPIIVIMGYNEGLQSALKKANIEYKILDKREKYDKNMYEIIKFNDGYIYYKLNYNSSLLLNGLKECNTEDYSIKDINSKSMWIEFLDIFGGRIKADGLDNFYDCMIDPITKEICEKYKLPTDYIEILAYSNMLLSDNKYNKHIDITGNRYRKNEIIAGYVYKAMADAYGDYRNQLKRNRKGVKMSMKQTAVVDSVLLDPTSSDLSILNPLLEYESGNSVSFKGLSGMNSDRSYGLDKRTFDDSMINLLAMSTGFAANVGLTRQATIDMNIEGKRGYIKATNNMDNMNTVKTLCMTEALTPFGSNHDDPFRSAMTFIQTSKHTMRTKKAMPCLVTNGSDEALPYLTSDTFAHKAKGKGRIIEKTDDYMIVEYDDMIPLSSGSADKDRSKIKEFIDLREHVRKNSDGGFYITVKLDSDYKKGDTVKKDDILAYDKLSYSSAIGSDDKISYNIGTLAKVAIMNTDEGFEDSTIISEYLSDAMTSDVVVKKEYVFPKNTNIYNMVKKGQEIQEGEPLIVFQNAFDEEDANMLLKNITDDEDLISELGRIHIKSKITGVVQDIKIYRTVEKDELSDSLRSKVNEYERNIKELNKVVDKHKNIINNVEVDADYKLEPTGKLKNAQDGVLIEFYLKYEDKMGIGDKLVYYSALKGVAKDIFPKGKEPYTDFRPEEKVHSLLAISSVNARMVSSVKKVGAINKTMIELDRKVKEIMGVKFKNLDEI